MLNSHCHCHCVTNHYRCELQLANVFPSSFHSLSLPIQSEKWSMLEWCVRYKSVLFNGTLLSLAFIYVHIYGFYLTWISDLDGCLKLMVKIQCRLQLQNVKCLENIQNFVCIWMHNVHLWPTTVVQQCFKNIGEQ